MKRRDTQTHVEGKGHVKMEAKIGVRGYRARNSKCCQEPPEAASRKDSGLDPPEGAGP